MQIADANVLIYAVDQEAEHHEAARTWLDRGLAGSETIGFAWVVVLAFLRLSTRPGIFSRPLGATVASAAVGRWLEQPAAAVVEPTPRHFGVLSDLLAAADTAGNLVNDAHLAALAIEHEAEIVSFDRDFGRFPGVRWRLPG